MVSTNLNANQLIIDAINSGSLSNEDAHTIIRGAGFKEDFGEGRATNFFSGNNDANLKALQDLQGRGLVAPQSLNEYVSSQVANPMLPSNTSMVPQTMQVQQGELESPVTQAQAPQIQTATINDLDSMMVDYQKSLDIISQAGDSGTYNAVTTQGLTPETVAAQGEVSNLATIKGQLEQMYQESSDGQVPIWAQGAMRKAEEVLAARGLGSSSIAAGAITAAIQESAINIAAPDAATYFQMDLTNLGNRQQVNLVNTQMKQQSLLSDQAALNAAAQFNASSTQQIEMFQAQLVSDIQTQNANRTASLEQFNAGQTNSVAQFNAGLQFQRDQFNANMAHVIDQSNVQWRRQINTANTASINAANQLNVQNKFNLSNYALNSLWQKSRDEANYLYGLNRDAQQYEYQLGMSGYNFNNSQRLQSSQFDQENEVNTGRALGSLAIELLKII